MKQLGNIQKEQGLVLRLQTCNPERPEAPLFTNKTRLLFDNINVTTKTHSINLLTQTNG